MLSCSNEMRTVDGDSNSCTDEGTWSQQGTFIKQWLVHFAHKEDAHLSAAEHKRLDELPSCHAAAKQLPVLINGSTVLIDEYCCLYVCTKSCWLTLLPFVRAMANLVKNFGHLKTFMCNVKSLKYLFWKMVACSANDRCEISDLVWFCFPTRYDWPFRRLLSHELQLFHGEANVLQYVGEHPVGPECLSGDTLRHKLLHIVHQGKGEFESLCSSINGSLSSDDAFGSYTGCAILSPSGGVTEQFFMSEEECPNERSTFWHHTLLKADGSHTFRSKEMDKASFMEIDEMDIKDIKIEGVTNCQKQICSSDQCMTSLQRRNDIEIVGYQKLYTFLEEYSNIMKNSRFQFCERDPCIVVECPVCPAAFKSIPDRLFRLANHVAEKHNHDKEDLMAMIEISNSRLLQCMRRRFEKEQ